MRIINLGAAVANYLVTDGVISSAARIVLIGATDEMNVAADRAMKLALLSTFCVLIIIAPSWAISGNASKDPRPEIFNAIGKIHIGGLNFCTGTLVRPDLVVTAAHCLSDRETKAVFRPEDVSVHFAVYGKRSRLTRIAKKLVTHPKYRFSDPAENNLRTDIAFLLLNQPVPEDVVKPIPIAAGLQRQARVSILSYSQHRRGNLKIDHDCKVLGASHLAVAFSCKVDFGASGAPVISWSGEHEPSLVSIIAAKAMMGEEPVALGAVIDTAAVAVLRSVSCAPGQPSYC